MPTNCSRSLVKRWHTVTVAPDSSSSSAIGRPTMFDAPTTTQCLPFAAMPVFSSSASHAVGRAGAHQRMAQREPADVERVEAVDVLAPDRSLR